MRVVSEVDVEYRVSKVVNGKNGDYWLHSFEDGESNLTFYSKDNADKLGLKKGEMYRLQFECKTFRGKNEFHFVGVAGKDKQ